MAAVKKITEEKIVSVALAIIKKSGMAALNARALATALGCSTRPIYLTFGSMEGVKARAVERITEIYQGYLKREVQSGKYPEYKAFGMGYIKFAREQREYFSYLFMRNRSGGAYVIDGGDINPVIDATVKATGLDRKRAELFHLEIWIFVHGIASMLATSYVDFSEADAEKMVTDMFAGLKTRFLSEGGN